MATRTATAVLTIVDDPTIKHDESYQIDLTISDTAYVYDQGTTYITPMRLVRETTIKRIGRNFTSVVESLTTRSKLIKKHVQAVERMHGTVKNDSFRFVADKL